MADIRPNKLHDLASYSVQYDMYMMHPEDFNNIQDELVYNKSASMANLGQLAYNFVENTHQIWLLTICDLIIGKREYPAKKKN